MNKKINTTIFIIGFLAVFSLMTVLVWADSGYPAGVRSISHGTSTGFNESLYSPSSTPAEAGNITNINLTAISATKSWQGYYGEVTGSITLENSLGNVFYNWTSNEPKGEVYASPNTTVNWSSVVCFQWTNDTHQDINLSQVEDWYDMEDWDGDGINETYASGLDDDWMVGTRNMTELSTGNVCHATNAYQNVTGGFQQQVDGNFENVILTDRNAFIFAARIENNEHDNQTDIPGFDGKTHDFQLLVAENGQEGYEDTTTTYYFWAEIE